MNGGCSVPVQRCSKTFLTAVDYSVLVVSCETFPPLTGSCSEVDMIITETYEIQLEACTSEVFLCTRFSPWYLWISSEWWSVSTCVTLPQDSSGLQRKRDCNNVSFETFALLTATHREGNVNITETYMSILAGNVGWGSKSTQAVHYGLISEAYVYMYITIPHHRGLEGCQNATT